MKGRFFMPETFPEKKIGLGNFRPKKFVVDILQEWPVIILWLFLIATTYYYKGFLFTSVGTVLCLSVTILASRIGGKIQVAIEFIGIGIVVAMIVWFAGLVTSLVIAGSGCIVFAIILKLRERNEIDREKEQRFH